MLLFMGAMNYQIFDKSCDRTTGIYARFNNYMVDLTIPYKNSTSMVSFIYNVQQKDTHMKILSFIVQENVPT